MAGEYLKNYAKMQARWDATNASAGGNATISAHIQAQLLAYKGGDATNTIKAKRQNCYTQIDTLASTSPSLTDIHQSLNAISQLTERHWITNNSYLADIVEFLILKVASLMKAELVAKKQELATAQTNIQQKQGQLDNLQIQFDQLKLQSDINTKLIEFKNQLDALNKEYETNLKNPRDAENIKTLGKTYDTRLKTEINTFDGKIYQIINPQVLQQLPQFNRELLNYARQEIEVIGLKAKLEKLCIESEEEIAALIKEYKIQIENITEIEKLADLQRDHLTSLVENQKKSLEKINLVKDEAQRGLTALSITLSREITETFDAVVKFNTEKADKILEHHKNLLDNLYLRRENDFLRQEIVKLKGEIKGSKEENEEQAKKIQSLSVDVAAISKDNSELASKQKKHQEEISTIQKKLKEEQNNLRTKTEAYDTLKQEKERKLETAQEKFQAKESEYIKLQEEFEKVNKLHEELKITHETLLRKFCAPMIAFLDFFESSPKSFLGTTENVRTFFRTQVLGVLKKDDQCQKVRGLVEEIQSDIISETQKDLANKVYAKEKENLKSKYTVVLVPPSYFGKTDNEFTKLAKIDSTLNRFKDNKIFLRIIDSDIQVIYKINNNRFKNHFKKEEKLTLDTEDRKRLLEIKISDDNPVELDKDLSEKVIDAIYPEFELKPVPEASPTSEQDSATIATSTASTSKQSTPTSLLFRLTNSFSSSSKPTDPQGSNFSAAAETDSKNSNSKSARPPSASAELYGSSSSAGPSQVSDFPAAGVGSSNSSGISPSSVPKNPPGTTPGSVVSSPTQRLFAAKFQGAKEGVANRFNSLLGKQQQTGSPVVNGNQASESNNLT